MDFNKYTGLHNPPHTVIDVETSCYQDTDGKWEASPYFVDGEGRKPSALWVGALRTPMGGPLVYAPRAFSHTGGMVVGHNFGFDYQHLLRPCGARFHMDALWDTMIAEYVMSAQAVKFASLGELMESRLGVPRKVDLIGNNLAVGIPPQDIPFEDIKTYLEGDLTNTEAAFRSQWTACTLVERELILVLSWASLVYSHCSHNGLLLDTAESVTRRDRCYHEVDRMMEGFKAVWIAGNPALKADIAAVDAKRVRDGDRSGQWAVTPTAMSSLFFNKPPDVHVGSLPAPALGARRVRQVKLDSPLRHSACPIELPSPQKGREALSTADDVLQKIVTEDVEPHASLARMEQHRRTNHKLGTTYYQALLEQGDKYCGRIHPRIHVVSTNTGRTSSSNPNIQNQPAETREVFIADPGEEFVEFDFQQLEIWALAVVSRCPKLIAALQAGDDIHYLTGLSAGMWSRASEMTKEKRTLVKRINFGLIYGGGAKTLSEQSGAPINTVRKIIAAFYGTFTGVKEYHEQVVPWVRSGKGHPPNSFFLERRTVTRMGTGGTVTDIIVRTATGRQYLFTEDTPGAGVSVTRIKNFFIQGFGTGDFVQLMLAELLTSISSDWWRAVIHDAALLCLPAIRLPDLQHELDRALRAALAHACVMWGLGIVMHIPLKLSIETKTRWSPMKEEEETGDLTEAA